jgi:hypothetical protein
MDNVRAKVEDIVKSTGIPLPPTSAFYHLVHSNDGDTHARTATSTTTTSTSASAFAAPRSKYDYDEEKDSAQSFNTSVSSSTYAAPTAARPPPAPRTNSNLDDSLREEVRHLTDNLRGLSMRLSDEAHDARAHEGEYSVHSALASEHPSVSETPPRIEGRRRNNSEGGVPLEEANLVCQRGEERKGKKKR